MQNSSSAAGTPALKKPFDHSLRRLIEESPLAYLRLFGLPGDAAEFMDADLSPATTEADRILRVALGGELVYLLHIEFQASTDRTIVRRMLEYNARIYRRYELPVVSLLMLLRAQADAPDLTGQLLVTNPATSAPIHDFRYSVLRLWQIPADELLSDADPYLAPLAVATDDSAARLPDVLRRIRERVVSDTTATEAGSLIYLTGQLLGLRYNGEILREMVKNMIKMDNWMRESAFYQMIVEDATREGERLGMQRSQELAMQRGQELGLQRGQELGLQRGQELGEAEATRALLLRLGRKRLGEPSPWIVKALADIRDGARLRSIAENLLEWESWEDVSGELREATAAAGGHDNAGTGS